MKARPEDIDALNPPLLVFYSAGGHPILAGRTLHYHVLPAGSFTPTREAAIVLAVNVDAETCNLRVFPAAGSAGITVTSVKEGPGPGEWSLPPILPRLTANVPVREVAGGTLQGPFDSRADAIDAALGTAAPKKAEPPKKPAPAKKPEPPKARKK